MKSTNVLMLIVFFSIISQKNSFSQTDSAAAPKNDQATAPPDSALLGLPGDNLDLYVVLDIFQNSKTIEDFEKALNTGEGEKRVNNLDLDLDGKVDFIKVTGTKKDEDFTFVLKVDVKKDETQDVAVILISKDKNKKVSMQIVGDKDLYGKNYIVELKDTKSPSVTPNPGYTGSEPVTEAKPASTTTVVVEQVPIVQYVYSPAYVPYVPPYYYGYYPPYFFAATTIAVGIYWGHHAYHHHHYGYGYHGNTTVIHNHNSFNNYNNYNRNSSNTVNHHNRDGSYNRGNNASTRPSTGAGGGRPSAGTQPSTRPSTGAGGTRPSAGTQPAGGGSRPSAGTQPSTRPSTGNSGGSRPSAGTQPSTRPSGGYSGSSTRPSTGYSGSSSRPSTQPSRSSGSYSGGGRSMGGGGYSGGGGGRSMGGGGGRGGGGRR